MQRDAVYITLMNRMYFTQKASTTYMYMFITLKNKDLSRILIKRDSVTGILLF